MYKHSDCGKILNFSSPWGSLPFSYKYQHLELKYPAFTPAANHNWYKKTNFTTTVLYFMLWLFMEWPLFFLCKSVQSIGHLFVRNLDTSSQPFFREKTLKNNVYPVHSFHRFYLTCTIRIATGSIVFQRVVWKLLHASNCYVIIIASCIVSQYLDTI